MIRNLFRMAVQVGVFALVVSYVRNHKRLSIRNPRAFVDTRPGPSV